jgi:hypothetical protein
MGGTSQRKRVPDDLTSAHTHRREDNHHAVHAQRGLRGKAARVGLDPYLLLLDLDANDSWEAISVTP